MARMGLQVLSLTGHNQLQVRDYKKRRVHSKTRFGCKTCKEKKVKCDEIRPVCLRCQRNSRPCVYIQHKENVTVPDSKCPGPTNPFSHLSDCTVFPFDAPSPRTGTSTIELMHHFRGHWRDVLNVSRGDAIISFFQTDPLLRNTILAMTACHLRHVAPGVLSHRIAEHYHTARALESYRKAILLPAESLGQPGANSVLLSATLLNMLALALPDEEQCPGITDPRNSWVFSNDENRLGWLNMQAGLRHLFEFRAAYLGDAMHCVSLMLFGLHLCAIAQERDSMKTVPQTWQKVFGLHGEEMDPESSKYTLLLDVVAAMKDCDDSCINAFVSMSFIFKLYSDFRDLLYHTDEKALWIFGYWLGIMSRFPDTWWCRARVIRDHKAILLLLEERGLTERPGDEGMLWTKLLEDYRKAPFPGSVSRHCT